MKKVTFILALGVILTLAACGSGSTATETNDSTVANVDTASVAVPVDSSASPVEGGGAAKEDAGKPVGNEAIK